MNMGNIRRFKIITPSDEQEQARCIARMTEHEQRESSERQLVVKLRTLKNGLMDDLLTGRVRVNGVDAGEDA